MNDAIVAHRAASRLAPLQILLAALLWSTMGPVKTLAPVGASPAALGAVRVLGGGVLLCAFARVRCGRGWARRAWATRADRTFLLLGSAAVAGYQAGFFGAVAHLGVAKATAVAMGTTPIVTGLLSRFLDGRALGPRWWAATAAAVSGVVLLSHGHAGHSAPVGLALGALASASFATIVVCIGALVGRGVEPIAASGQVFMGGAAVLTPVLAAGPISWVLTGRGALVSVHLAVLGTTVAYWLYSSGLRSTRPPVAATISLAEPASATLLGVVLLHEHLTAPAWLGLALLGAGLVTMTVPVRPFARRRARPTARRAAWRSPESLAS